jgi:hypothetical protein
VAQVALEVVRVTGRVGVLENEAMLLGHSDLGFTIYDCARRLPA